MNIRVFRASRMEYFKRLLVILQYAKRFTGFYADSCQNDGPLGEAYIVLPLLRHPSAWEPQKEDPSDPSFDDQLTN